MTTTERRLLGGKPITRALNGRDRRLPADATVAEALELFENRSVQVIPIVDSARYVGAVDRRLLGRAAPSEPVTAHLEPGLLPTVTAQVPATEALALLDREGGTRLVVLADDGVTYLGLVCLRSDRARLCVESECHAEAL
ncbi:MAG: CBS domain-containing protein [Gaiellales bacterium]